MSGTIITKSDIQHAIQVLSGYIKTVPNGYTKSLLGRELEKQKNILERWDGRQLILDEFTKLVQSHSVYSETIDYGYGDGSDTTWVINGKPNADCERFFWVDCHLNYDILINEADEKIDSNISRTHYSYKIKANDDG